MREQRELPPAIGEKLRRGRGIDDLRARSWLEILREDNRAILRAASQASKAADWLLAHLPDTEGVAARDEQLDRRAA